MPRGYARRQEPSPEMTAKMPRSYRHVATYDGNSYRRRLRQRRLISNTTRLRTTAIAIVFTSVREVRITQAYEGVKHSTYGKLTRENRTPFTRTLQWNSQEAKRLQTPPHYWCERWRTNMQQGLFATRDLPLLRIGMVVHIENPNSIVNQRYRFRHQTI